MVSEELHLGYNNLFIARNAESYTTKLREPPNLTHHHFRLVEICFILERLVKCKLD